MAANVWHDFTDLTNFKTVAVNFLIIRHNVAELPRRVFQNYYLYSFCVEPSAPLVIPDTGDEGFLALQGHGPRGRVPAPLLAPGRSHVVSFEKKRNIFRPVKYIF